MKDIENTNDIILLVDEFYKSVNADELLSPVFNQSAKVNWDTHLEKMYRFWGTMLIGTMNYSGSPFDKHVGHGIASIHFDRWLAMFTKTIDLHFEGPKAEEAKAKAANIGNIFNNKLQNI
ncbi:MAG: group III truncated hemoglobin [Bacteroidetes bacterium]|nr:group III truncated hemoglobin [Bacteroidota bacterium]